MPRFALFLGIVSLGCSLSVAAFFVGVPLGLMSVLLALSGWHRSYPRSRQRKASLRALTIGAVGLCAGLGVWFVHVRAIQTAYHLPSRPEVAADFERSVSAATAPLPGAPPRTPAPPPQHQKDVP